VYLKIGSLLVLALLPELVLAQATEAEIEYLNQVNQHFERMTEFWQVEPTYRYSSQAELEFGQYVCHLHAQGKSPDQIIPTWRDDFKFDTDLEMVQHQYEVTLYKSAIENLCPNQPKP
jgi:hypothetical protein